MPKRILIATGGTGGHIYPAIALAQQFEREQKDVEILFIGGGLSQNSYFDKEAFDFRTVSCGAFTNKSPFALLRSGFNISKGIWQSCGIIRKFRPDVAVGFGSYYSFPPLVAAKLQSVPIILHEANSIPGKVNRLLAPYALAVGVHFPQTLGMVKGKNYEVGMPLRNPFKKGSRQRAEAMEYFGLSGGKITLLVFGGSQGAQIINNQIQDALRFINLKNLQVIHIAGSAGQVAPLIEGYRELGIPACVKPFEQHMEIAWEVADLVISRAGASSIAEQLEFEVPGILIPFARAADNHQNHNADFLVDTVKGAKKLQECELSASKLAEMMITFLEDEGKLLAKMKKAMGDYKRMARKHDLYALIKEVVTEK